MVGFLHRSIQDWRCPMVGSQFYRDKLLKSRLPQIGVTDPKVIRAFSKVRREAFIARDFRGAAYADFPLPIGEYQTISQPSLVALMTQYLDLLPGHKVLEVGTGSGYQTAILAELAHEVYSVEVRPTLSRRAQKILHHLGYHNIHFRIGDGAEGWEEYTPYDRIIVTAAAPTLPPTLAHQLSFDGRIIIPLGTDQQYLHLFKNTVYGLDETILFPVSFVSMTTTKGAKNAQSKVRLPKSKSHPGAGSKLREGKPGIS
jgi:protein-L-isoaspartate(D-aspartate) O-methyltransferase